MNEAALSALASRRRRARPGGCSSARQSPPEGARLATASALARIDPRTLQRWRQTDGPAVTGARMRSGQHRRTL